MLSLLTSQSSATVERNGASTSAFVPFATLPVPDCLWLRPADAEFADLRTGRSLAAVVAAAGLLLFFGMMFVFARQMRFPLPSLCLSLATSTQILAKVGTAAVVEAGCRSRSFR